MWQLMTLTEFHGTPRYAPYLTIIWFGTQPQTTKHPCLNPSAEMSGWIFFSDIRRLILLYCSALCKHVRLAKKNAAGLLSYKNTVFFSWNLPCITIGVWRKIIMSMTAGHIVIKMHVCCFFVLIRRVWGRYNLYTRGIRKLKNVLPLKNNYW
jgi:hypothetical protein